MISDRQLTELSDSALVAAVGERVGTPLIGEPNSFILHAPLELMARAALLPLVAPATRQAVRRRIAEIGRSHAACGSPAPLPDDEIAPGEARAVLAESIHSGAPGAACVATRLLARSTDPPSLAAALAPLIDARTSAAGHAAIGLHLFLRHGSGAPVTAWMLGTTIHAVARDPSLKVQWLDHPPPHTAADGRGLEAVLSGVPSAPDPGSDFIAPTMAAVDSAEVAGTLLAAPTSALDPEVARRCLLRVAARSMLQDDPTHARYGWTHCFTMPQATLGLSPFHPDGERLVRIASTWVLGFRATLGSVELDADWEPDDDDAAALAWRADSTRMPHIVEAIASTAAAHPDAHLAKYALACLDAAADDPASTRLFLAAASRLVQHWTDEV